MLEQDKRALEQLVKTFKRCEFIQKAELFLFLYKFEPDDYIELVGKDETSKRSEYLTK